MRNRKRIHPWRIISQASPAVKGVAAAVALGALVTGLYQASNYVYNNSLRFHFMPAIKYQVQPGDTLWNIAGSEGLIGKHKGHYSDAAMRDNDSSYTRNGSPLIGPNGELRSGETIWLRDANRDGRVGITNVTNADYMSPTVGYTHIDDKFLDKPK